MSSRRISLQKTRHRDATSPREREQIDIPGS
jgi:hypothetical protein